MADRDVVKKTYLTDEEAARLSEWADEVGKSESHLLREAIQEYLDHDRAARVEERLDRIEGKIDDLAPAADATTTHTHKPESGMKQGSPAIEKAREIVRRLQRETDNPDGVVQQKAVERAIEDIAGVDPRTLNKYKRIFRRRGLLFEHPGEPEIWTLQSEQWLAWMEDYLRLNGQKDAERVADEYPAEIIAGGDGFHIELAEVDDA